jgi:hypothetical protein
MWRPCQGRCRASNVLREQSQAGGSPLAMCALRAGAYITGAHATTAHLRTFPGLPNDRVQRRATASAAQLLRVRWNPRFGVCTKDLPV